MLSGFTVCKECKLVILMNKSTTKYPIIDQDFFPKMLAESHNDKERGMVIILYYSGMHVSNLIELTPSDFKKEGGLYRLEWRRKKTAKAMSCIVPNRFLEPVRTFLEARKPSRQYVHRVIKEIGHNAGYDDISPMTFRHSKCVRAFMPKEQGGDGHPFFVVNQIMGCSMGVVVRNYAQMTDRQLNQEGD